MIDLTKEQKELLNEAIATWGEASQVLMAIEEMSELTKELCKTFRGGYGTDLQKTAKINENIREELGDVLIMMHQLGVMFDPHFDKVRESIEYKMERTRKKLDEEHEKP